MVARSPWVWFNGRLVPWDQATVHVTVHALHYGTSVFEGIRAYETPRGPAIFRLRPHLGRLFFSARLLRMEIPYTEEDLARAIVETVRANGHRSCYIRPLVFRGSETMGLDGRSCPVEVAIVTFEWGQYLGREALEKGVDVMVSSWRRMAPGAFPALCKIGGQYVNSQLAVMEAHDQGCAEAIMLDIYGYVAEGTGENLFLVKDGVLYTPPLHNSILLGVTRDAVLALAREQGLEVREQPIPREWLYAADEIFMTGTAAEITPVRSVDRIPIGGGAPGPVTRRLQERFFAIVSGEAPDIYGWLTWVDR
ncbi:MAG: branched chain amino acid aminotransferase [Thermoflexus sp.]|uniref:branched-chain amino acid transaminase n=1 Tax=Thermoflexus sp. TaxID=1969742 RepID=UPI00331F5503